MVIDHLLFRLTVDGSEIRREPVEVGSLSQKITRFYTSQVVQDFSTVVFKSTCFFSN